LVLSWAEVAAEVAAIASIFAVIVGIVGVIMSRKQLRLAQEGAELRPKLVISFQTVVYHHRPPNPGSQYEQAAIVFDVTNDGRSAAHNVQCEIRLDERHLIPDDMYGTNHDFFSPHLGPSATEPHQINVGVLSHGSTEASYRCVCDEVGESEGSIEFKVPERK